MTMVRQGVIDETVFLRLGQTIRDLPKLADSSFIATTSASEH